ncbi:hypothetical protein [Desulfuribacillus stibiiarsenatis]|uniref:hypothetical protein n=1 Tax=Desulfuribacillus stibiiarsenatis TaxID=1390249 RepID=UPI0015B59E6B|nr:hypothetical protein [Desulfuribacillus stibiiarsenatis]
MKSIIILFFIMILTFVPQSNATAEELGDFKKGIPCTYIPADLLMGNPNYCT